MTSSSRDLYALQAKVWEGSVPLEIRLASAECTTYGVSDAFLVCNRDGAKIKPWLMTADSLTSHLLPATHTPPASCFFQKLLDQRKCQILGRLAILR